MSHRAIACYMQLEQLVVFCILPLNYGHSDTATVHVCFLPLPPLPCRHSEQHGPLKSTTFVVEVHS